MTDLSKWWAGSILNLADFYGSNIKDGLSIAQIQKKC